MHLVRLLILSINLMELARQFIILAIDYSYMEYHLPKQTFKELTSFLFLFSFG